MNFTKILGDALPIISESAPLLGAAFGLPGTAAGYVLKIMAKAFGRNPQDIPGIIQDVLTHPDAKDILAGLNKDHGPIVTFLSSLRSPTEAEVTIRIKWPEQQLGTEQ